jgi:hypothetical protein
LTLCPKYSYTNSHDLPAISKAIVSIIRLYLLYEISHYSPGDAEALAKTLDSAEIPFGDFPRLHGSKTVARPGDLSPGEYGMLVEILPIYLMEKDPDLGEEAMDKWCRLLVVQNGLQR